MWGFQGDLFSPLPFCISLMHLTEQLNELNPGYEEHITKTKVSHLLFVDDLKLISKTEEEIQKEMQAVRNFSNDIHMKFGHDKCVKILLKRGKLVYYKI